MQHHGCLPFCFHRVFECPIRYWLVCNKCPGWTPPELASLLAGMVTTSPQRARLSGAPSLPHSRQHCWLAQWKYASDYLRATPGPHYPPSSSLDPRTRPCPPTTQLQPTETQPQVKFYLLLSFHLPYHPKTRQRPTETRQQVKFYLLHISLQMLMTTRT